MSFAVSLLCHKGRGGVRGGRKNVNFASQWDASSKDHLNVCSQCQLPSDPRTSCRESERAGERERERGGLKPYYVVDAQRHPKKKTEAASPLSSTQGEREEGRKRDRRTEGRTAWQSTTISNNEPKSLSRRRCRRGREGGREEGRQFERRRGGLLARLSWGSY